MLLVRVQHQELLYGILAQSVEQYPFKVLVLGSSPRGSILSNIITNSLTYQGNFPVANMYVRVNTHTKNPRINQ